MRSKALLFAGLLLISACSFTREVGDRWVMTLPNTNSAEGERVGTATYNSTLKVELPESPSHLETQRVAVTRPDGALDYYAGARWADMLPLHVQQALVGGLQQQGIYRQVVSDEVAAPTMYHLFLQMRDFSVTHQGGQPQAVLSFGYTLQKNLKVLHSGTASGQAMLTGESRAEIQQGFAEAYQQLVMDLAGQLKSYK